MDDCEVFSGGRMRKRVDKVEAELQHKLGGWGESLSMSSTWGRVPSAGQLKSTHSS